MFRIPLPLYCPCIFIPNPLLFIRNTKMNVYCTNPWRTCYKNAKQIKNNKNPESISIPLICNKETTLVLQFTV